MRTAFIIFLKFSLAICLVVTYTVLAIGFYTVVASGTVSIIGLISICLALIASGLGLYSNIAENFASIDRS
mgnify:CR=1 FL=1